MAIEIEATFEEAGIKPRTNLNFEFSDKLKNWRETWKANREIEEKKQNDEFRPPPVTVNKKENVRNVNIKSD